MTTKAKPVDPRLLELVDVLAETYREEMARLRGKITTLTEAIRDHQEQSLGMVQEDPRVRLSEADYHLWEVLEQEGKK